VRVNAQNNSLMYALVYTCTKGSWIIQPYVLYTDVPANQKGGITRGASTRGVTLLANHTFKHGFSLAGRCEDISSTGNPSDGSVNLLYGPGSAAWSIMERSTSARFLDHSSLRARNAAR